MLLWWNYVQHLHTKIGRCTGVQPDDKIKIQHQHTVVCWQNAQVCSLYGFPLNLIFLSQRSRGLKEVLGISCNYPVRHSSENPWFDWMIKFLHSHFSWNFFSFSLVDSLIFSFLERARYKWISWQILWNRVRRMTSGRRGSAVTLRRIWQRITLPSQDR